MRQGPNPKRGRGRGNGRKAPNNRSQTFDSNGPSVRVRGNAFQVQEKYLALARDAAASGDRVAAENYFQHAEHYLRIINAANAQAEARRDQQGNGEDQGDRSGGDDRGRRSHSGDDDDQPSEQTSRGHDDDDEGEEQEKPGRAKRGNGRGRPKKAEVQADDEGEDEGEPLDASSDDDGESIRA